MEQLKTRNKFSSWIQQSHLTHSSSLNSSYVIWSKILVLLQGSLACLTVAEFHSKTCQACVVEVQVVEMTSTKSMKTMYANISTYRHADRAESLTQMAVLLNAFMTIASTNQKEHQWTRWSSQEIGSASNGLQVNSATVEEMTTPFHSTPSETHTWRKDSDTPSKSMNDCEGTKMR